VNRKSGKKFETLMRTGIVLNFLLYLGSSTKEASREGRGIVPMQRL